MAKIRVNKPEAARRQIDAAIRLLFDNGDPIAVHTLAAAGARILRDLCANRGLDGRYRRLIRPEMEQQFWQRLNAPANFFKHADRDADEILDNVQEEVNDLFLLMAVDDYHSLGVQLTPEMEAILWFNIVLRPDWIDSGAPAAEAQVARQVAASLDYLPSRPRSEQLATGKLLLAAVRARTRYIDDLPTARATLAAGMRLLVWCASGHQVDEDLAAIIARRQGGVAGAAAERRNPWWPEGPGWRIEA